jgi:inosose dehydratase
VKLRVGVAPDSWGIWFPSDPLQPPWQRYLDEIVQAGFEWTELGPYGYLPTDPTVLRGELERRGLGLLGGTQEVALHDAAALPDGMEQTLRVCELVATLGGRFLVLLPAMYSDVHGALLRPTRPSEDQWKQQVEGSNALGRMVQERFGGQLTLAFHPHGDSYVETPEQVERYLAETDPRTVAICMDTGHYAYRGGDPIDFMRRHHDRAPYLHIKTVDGALRERAQAEQMPFVKAVQIGTFCEPEQGSIDFAAFAAVLREIHYDGWAAVEQDMYPCDFDVPLPVARRTRAYLARVGLS